jgi:ATP-dependent Clp protease ATP-binding subunit ClpC
LEPSPPTRLGRIFERFTERARQVVVLAQGEARALKHNYIGTEHLLLGLLRVEDGLAARVLDSLDITMEEARVKVARIVGPGDEVTSGQIPFTPRAKKVLELSVREALSLGHNFIGTEHVLLALARENQGVAARILLDFGADAEKIRNEVIRAIPGFNPEDVASATVVGRGASVRMQDPRLPQRVATYAPGRDDSTLLITGAAIATAGLAVGLALGWLFWG